MQAPISPRNAFGNHIEAAESVSLRGATGKTTSKIKPLEHIKTKQNQRLPNNDDVYTCILQHGDYIF